MDLYCTQVVTVHPFETEEEAIDLANNNQYGLSCSVWSENGKRARRVAESIQVGYVWVNCWMVRDLRVPFGGVKQSGMYFNSWISRDIINFVLK